MQNQHLKLFVNGKYNNTTAAADSHAQRIGLMLLQSVLQHLRQALFLFRFTGEENEALKV